MLQDPASMFEFLAGTIALIVAVTSVLVARWSVVQSERFEERTLAQVQNSFEATIQRYDLIVGLSRAGREPSKTASRSRSVRRPTTRPMPRPTGD
jgi:hypothetical protein